MEAELKQRAEIERAELKQRAEIERAEVKKRAEAELKERSRLDAEYGTLLTKNQDLVDKFLEIAERKVSVVDDYGDENWSVLPDEIHRCLTKIAKREPAVDMSKVQVRSDVSPVAKSVDGKMYREESVRYLAASLESKFSAHHEARRRFDPAVGDFRELAGVEFEIYLANVLKACGFEVSGTPTTGDQGADLIVKKDGRTIAIQAKGYRQPVGNGAVQEIVAALRFYKADEGWVVTNSGFTTSARALAHANNIRLIDGQDLKTFSVSKPEPPATPPKPAVRLIDL